MGATRQRLIGCFTTVFPKLAPEQVVAATLDSTHDWDSTRHFLLMQVVEEEFSLQIPEEMIGEMVSFAGFEDYLERESKVS